MADDTGGGTPSDSEIASAFVSIGASLNPLMATMAALPGMLAAPLTKTSDGVKSFLGDTLDNAFASTMRGRLGDLIAGLGQSLVGGVAGTLRRLMTTVLGDTIGGALATITVAPIAKVASGIFGAIGAVVEATTGPLHRAIAANLSDLDQWVEKSITLQADQARFAAVLRASGEVAGWTGRQLGIIADHLSSLAGASQYSREEIQKAETALLSFQNVRGDRFTQALAAAMDLAAAKGMSLESAVHVLGLALEQPAHGFEHLRRSAGVTFSAMEGQAIKTAATVEQAQDLILKKIQSRLGGVAEAMAGTTEGLLAGMRNAWNSIGISIGSVLEPVTHTLANLGKPLIEWLAGAVKPVFTDLRNIVSNAMASVQSFFDRNIGTFREWGRLASETIRGVYERVKELFGGIFAHFNIGGMEGVQRAFDGIKGTVTSVLTGMRDIVGSWDAIKAAGNVAWVFIKNKAQDFWEWFTAKDTWSGAWASLKSGLSAVFDWLMKTMEKIGDFIGSTVGAGIGRALSKSLAGGSLDKYLGGYFSESLKQQQLEAQGDAAEARRKAREALEAGPQFGGGGAGAEQAAADERAKRDKELADATDLLTREMLKNNVAAAIRRRQDDAAARAANELGRSHEEAVGSQNGQAAKTVGFAQMFEQIRSGIMGSFQDRQLEEAKRQRIAAEKAADLLGRINDKMDKPGGPPGIGFGVA